MIKAYKDMQEQELEYLNEEEFLTISVLDIKKHPQWIEGRCKLYNNMFGHEYAIKDFKTILKHHNERNTRTAKQDKTIRKGKAEA